MAKPRGRRPGQKNKTKDTLAPNDDSMNEKNEEGKAGGSQSSHVLPKNERKSNGYVPTGKPRGRRPGQKNKTNVTLAPNDDSMKEKNEEGKADGSPLVLPENRRKSNGYVLTGKPRGRRPGQKNKNKISGTFCINDDAHTNEKGEERRKEREERRKEDELALLRLPEVEKKRKYDYISTGMPRGRRPGQKNKKTISAERQREVNALRRANNTSE